jgi:hypothetical protein
MGIDVRGQGGYFIAPPSIGKHGKRYEIADPADFFQFAEAPGWLYELIVKKPPPLPAQPADDSIIERALATIRPPGSLSAMANRPFVDAVLRGEYEAVASIPSEGCQNDQLNISSMKLGKYVAGGVINEHEAIETMMRACTANGLLDETGRYACMATIESGMSFGKTQPKGIPERKADNVVPIKGDSTSKPPPPPLHATPYAWKDPKKIPLRDWLYGYQLIRKFVSGTISPGGVGKSSLTAAEALAMVSGKNLLGVAPKSKLRVWIWNLALLWQIYSRLCFSPICLLQYGHR